MTRRLPQPALCFILCPLLAAQQVAQAASPAAAPPSQPAPAPVYMTLPADAEIELLAPGPTEFAKASPGVAVQFVVDKDVVLAGEIMIHAGVPVTGIVDHVKRGSHRRHRDGEMEIRVTKIVPAEPIELHLRCFEQAGLSGGGNAKSRTDARFNPDKGAIIGGIAGVVAAILVMALYKEK